MLLVHGTGVTGDTTWGWSYLRALPAPGVDTCYVDLPDQALDDIQDSAEYVVYAAPRSPTRSARSCATRP